MRIVLPIALAVCCSTGWALGRSGAQANSSTTEQAEKLIAAHHPAQAEELLAPLLSQDPGNPAALDDLGMIRLQQNRNHEAEELFQQALASRPGFLPAQIHLGQAELADRLYDDALPSFEAALALAPKDAEAAAGEVNAATQAALASRNAGDMNGALAYLVRGRKYVPDNPELILDFGVQAEAMHIYKDADEALSRGRTLYPDDQKILYALARVQLDEQKMPEAEANLRAYIQLRPDDPSAHYGLGHLLHMEVKNDEAQAELKKSIELQPRQTAAYYELGDIALDLHRDDEARANYQKVLTLDPNHGGALTGMGILAFRAKDNTSAEKYLRDAVLYAAEYPAAHRYYAVLLARLGRTEEAGQQAAIAKELTDRQTQLSRGYTLTQTP